MLYNEKITLKTALKKGYGRRIRHKKKQVSIKHSLKIYTMKMAKKTRLNIRKHTLHSGNV